MLLRWALAGRLTCFGAWSRPGASLRMSFTAQRLRVVHASPAEAACLGDVKTVLRRHLQEAPDELGAGRGEGVEQHLPLQACPETEGAGVLEQRAHTRLRGRPRVLLRHQREERHTEREGVCQVGIVLFPVVHLRRLVGRLAPHLLGARSREGRHGEVDELHLHAAAPGVGDQHVLQRYVPVRDPELVQPVNGGEDLVHDRQHQPLARRPWLRPDEAPREEVPLGRQGCHHVRALGVAEHAEEVAHVGEAHAVELREHGQVAPRLLAGVGVVRPELLRPGRHPLVGHLLHRYVAPPVPAASHQVDLAVVPARALQPVHEHEAVAVPGLHAAGDLGRGLREVGPRQAPHVPLRVPSGLPPPMQARGGRAPPCAQLPQSPCRECETSFSHLPQTCLAHALAAFGSALLWWPESGAETA
eukprot:CAMPEP_0179362418 /NCGR_PEP_ID=MMETSP0797-20121207/81003_1 /TAXON_ID=47934 /ORGANISM="Dinophysis acuminata, Strain DAEP01" /LENGTH=415 /DNA_ID=CAMNT_0021077845 /DNA_START=20 /DNA_END=1267 /DNA_ORIENTATION=+